VRRAAKDHAGATTAARSELANPPAGARAITVVSRQRLGARLEEWTLQTPALARPDAGRVLLPAGYGANASRRYPVLYLLHGADSDYRSWTRYGDAQAITATRPMIVVMPDGGTDGWYTDWYAATGPCSRAGRPTTSASSSRGSTPPTGRSPRAAAGRSPACRWAATARSSYAARHPGTFAAAASFSGALEVGSADAWGERSANEARWRAHLPISIAARCGRSRSSSCAPATDGRARSIRAARSRAARPARSSASCTRQRAPPRAPAGARHPPRLGRLRPGTHDWPYWRRDLRETMPDLVRVLARA
jgi:S-formylglutathione hydrolase FrmB